MKLCRVRVLSPAKINLYLNVLGRRDDGFHEVKTVLQAIDLCDRIEIAKQPAGISLEVVGSNIPADNRNLAWRAADSFLRHARCTQGVRIRIAKHIPVAAGLGGGSSNAACTLLGLNALFQTGYGPAELARQGKALGADMPFFLRGTPSLGVGKGSDIISLDRYTPFWVLLVMPVGDTPSNKTARVYSGLSKILTKRAKPITITLAAIETKDVKALGRGLFNRLQEVVLGQDARVRAIWQFLRREGVTARLVSGAGPTVFALMPNRAAGLRVARRAQAKFKGSAWVRLVRTRECTPSPRPSS